MITDNISGLLYSFRNMVVSGFLLFRILPEKGSLHLPPMFILVSRVIRGVCNEIQRKMSVHVCVHAQCYQVPEREQA